MNTKLVEINLHGSSFEGFKNKYKLSVRSVMEAFHAINCMSGGKFFKVLLENERKNIKYEILINKNPCLFSEPPSIDNIDSILNSEVCAEYPNLQTIDIVPVMEGAYFDWIALVVYVIIALIAAALTYFLMKPPKLSDFKATPKVGSYLFDGPENTTGEGDPVTLVYGRLLVGSHTILSTYDIAHKDASKLLTV